MLLDIEVGLLENRSNAFSASAVTVPEPGTLALLMVTLAGVAGSFRRRSVH